MRTQAAAALAMSVFYATANAQQELIGIYKGEYWERGAYVHPHVQVATLRIVKIENGKATGKLQLDEKEYRGAYEVEGTYKDNQLSLQTSAGPMPGCAQQITLTGKGNKLVGNFSAEAPSRPGVELVKQ